MVVFGIEPGASGHRASRPAAERQTVRRQPGVRVKLEFLEESSDGPTILLSGSDPNEAARLRKEFRELSEWPTRRLSLHELPFIEAVNQCEVTASSGSRDVGVKQKSEAPSFNWILKQLTWSNVEGLLEPFCVQGSGTRFQFLNPSFGPEVIFSTTGKW